MGKEKRVRGGGINNERRRLDSGWEHMLQPFASRIQDLEKEPHTSECTRQEI